MTKTKKIALIKKGDMKEIEKELQQEQNDYMKTLVKEKVKNIKRLELTIDRAKKELEDILSGKQNMTEEQYLFEK